MSATNAADREWFGHPRGLKTLFFTELWERLSYYGMRGLLILFMVDQVSGMSMERGTAAAIYGLYTAGVYVMALPGGWVADRLIGLRQAVFVGGVIIALGHFSMAIPTDVTFFLGLILIVIGTGLLKPNVSAIVGDLYPEGGGRRDAGFSVYYMGINIGALFGPLICGFLGENVDWHLGFSAAGIGMVFGLIQYKMGQKYLGDAGLRPETDGAAPPWRLFGLGLGGVAAAVVALTILQSRGVVNLTLQGVAETAGKAILALVLAYFLFHFIFGFLAGKLTGEEMKRLVVIFLLFIGAALFWAGFEQAGSSMNLFAENKTQLEGPLVTLILGIPVLLMLFWLVRRVRDPGVRNGLLALVVLATLGVLGWSLTPAAREFLTPASWLQSVNPLFIIVLAPVFGWLWIALGNRNPSMATKFGYGLVLLGVGFLVMRWAAVNAASGSQVTPWWLVTTYFFHTCGELCLSPVGLSSITKLSPKRLVGQMMGIWFMGAALGNLIAGLAAGTSDDVLLFTSVAKTSIIAGFAFLVLSIPIQMLSGEWAARRARLAAAATTTGVAGSADGD